MSTQAWRADAEELTRVAAGDDGAFRRLYDAHHGRVVRLAYGVLQDREQARDIAHDVMIKLLRAAAAWEPHAAVSTWLRRVTLNECLSWRRRLLRRRRHEDPVDPAPAIDATESDAPSPHEVAQGVERRRSLRAALAGLAPRDRAIVVLHVDEGMAPREIAATLSMNDNAARVALHRALTRLRAALGATP